MSPGDPPITYSIKGRGGVGATTRKVEQQVGPGGENRWLIGLFRGSFRGETNERSPERGVVHSYPYLCLGTYSRSPRIMSPESPRYARTGRGVSLNYLGAACRLSVRPGSPIHTVRGSCKEGEPTLPSVPCPLSDCRETHELREARNRARTPYVNCPTWSSTVFFRTSVGKTWLANGGSARGRMNPPMERIVATEGAGDEEGDGDPRPTYTCPRCGASVLDGASRCGSCSEPIDWVGEPEETEDENNEFPF